MASSDVGVKNGEESGAMEGVPPAHPQREPIRKRLNGNPIRFLHMFFLPCGAKHRARNSFKPSYVNNASAFPKGGGKTPWKRKDARDRNPLESRVDLLEEGAYESPPFYSSSVSPCCVVASLLWQ
jgi:hypothetical protein